MANGNKKRKNRREQLFPGDRPRGGLPIPIDQDQQPSPMIPQVPGQVQILPAPVQPTPQGQTQPVRQGPVPPDQVMALGPREDLPKTIVPTPQAPFPEGVKRSPQGILVTNDPQKAKQFEEEFIFQDPQTGDSIMFTPFRDQSGTLRFNKKRLSKGLPPDVSQRNQQNIDFLREDPAFSADVLPIRNEGVATQVPPLPSEFGFDGGRAAQFRDVLDPIQLPVNVPDVPERTVQQIFRSPTFERGLKEISPKGGIRPETQRILDIIGQRTEEARKRAISSAQALAGRRGLSGSSIEQFGVSEAGRGVEQAGLEATIPILERNLAEEQLRGRQRAEALLGRATRETGARAGLVSGLLGAEEERRAQISSLTSDELASLRNIQLQRQSLEIQRQLGEKGVAVSAANIEAAKSAAKDQAQADLWSGVIGAIGNIFS